MAAVIFHFAWVDEGAEFDPDTMAREDEDVFSFVMRQQEGDFAALEMVIKNPRVGLLAPGRKVWMWLSYSVDGGEAQPLFYGRLIGIPSNIFDTLVTINFIARPVDFNAQKEALAATLRVAPYWDDIFISPDKWTDPDVVLEARSQIWHIDPITHELTVSDIINPEDGVIDIATNFFYDSLSITLNEVPLTSVRIEAGIPWTQSASGQIDLTNAFIYRWPGGADTKMLTSFTMPGLVNSWPKSGAKIGSGWTAVESELVDLSTTAVKLEEPPEIFDPAAVPPLPEGSVSFPIRVVMDTVWGEKAIGSPIWIDAATIYQKLQGVWAPLGYGKPKMTATYSANRKFMETIVIELKTAQQAIATLPGDDERLLITINSNEVTDLDYNGDIPIGSSLKRSYADSPRGKQSIEYLLNLGRANLVARSRTVVTEFQTDFLTGINVTLRKGVHIEDGRIPGGEVLGKCTGYVFSVDGSTGEALATITIASTVGYGGSYSSVPGEPTYAEADYCGNDYQMFVNEIVALPTSDVAWTPPDADYFDDGVDFERGFSWYNAFQILDIENPAGAQRAALENLEFGDTVGTDLTMVQSLLQSMPTRVHMRLIPMEGGPFSTIRPVTVTDLIVPKQIDLEAAS